VTVVVFHLARYFAACHELLEQGFLFTTLNAQSFWQQWNKASLLIWLHTKMLRGLDQVNAVPESMLLLGQSSDETDYSGSNVSTAFPAVVAHLIYILLAEVSMMD